MTLARPNNVSIMICAWEWGAYLGEKQLRLTVSSYCRPHPRSIKIEAKVCGHYVNSIRATDEANMLSSASVQRAQASVCRRIVSCLFLFPPLCVCKKGRVTLFHFLG